VSTCLCCEPAARDIYKTGRGLTDLITTTTRLPRPTPDIRLFLCTASSAFNKPESFTLNTCKSEQP
jgi:hypothetical protein